MILVTWKRRTELGTTTRSKAKTPCGGFKSERGGRGIAGQANACVAKLTLKAWKTASKKNYFLHDNFANLRVDELGHAGLGH